MPRFAGAGATCCLLLSLTGTLTPALVRADEAREASSTIPKRYILDYPQAERFSPPTRGFFVDAGRTFDPEKRVRHKLNGGFGLPISTKVNGQNLLHLGADVAWRRVGEPVFAIAHGVVRQSEGPAFDGKARAVGKHTSSKGGDPSHFAWGNFIAIEHRLADGVYITSIYGHLDTERLVKVGELVEAGQQIGVIGRNHSDINGGYDPHLHFAIRDGRLAETGAAIVSVQVDGKLAAVELIAVTEDEAEVKLPGRVRGNVTLTLRDLYSNAVQRVDFVCRDSRWFAPASFLWHVKSRPGFQLDGYGLSTEGWRHPVRFLDERGAVWKPARRRQAAAR